MAAGPAGTVVAAALAPVVVAGAGAGPGADVSSARASVALLDAAALHPPESPLTVGRGSAQVAPGIVLALGAPVAGPGATPAAAAADALALDEARLEAGWLVWCGALLPPAEVPAGSHARAAFGHLGVVTLRCT